MLAPPDEDELLELEELELEEELLELEDELLELEELLDEDELLELDELLDDELELEELLGAVGPGAPQAASSTDRLSTAALEDNVFLNISLPSC